MRRSTCTCTLPICAARSSTIPTPRATSCPSGGKATVSSLAAACTPLSDRPSPLEPEVVSEAQVAYWIEQAAAHQCRALRCLQELRGQGGPLPSSSETRTGQDGALQSLLAARRAVLRAQAMASGTEHISALQVHLAQLDAHIQALEEECPQTEAGSVAHLAR